MRRAPGAGPWRLTTDTMSPVGRP